MTLLMSRDPPPLTVGGGSENCGIFTQWDTKRKRKGKQRKRDNFILLYMYIKASVIFAVMGHNLVSLIKI